MSILKKDSIASRQLSLLQGTLIIEGRLADVPPQLRAAIGAAIKGSALSRWQIAGQISELMNRELTKFMLDAYTAESHEGHRFPAELLPALCLVTDSHQPLDVLARAIGCALVGPEESSELEITRLRVERTKLEQRIKALERGR